MSKSLDSLKAEIASLDNYGQDKQREILSALYLEHNLSWPEIASLGGTYSNKIRRLANKLGIKSKNRAEAQRNALASNRHPHPTKDKGHDESTKLKMSEVMSAHYQSMDEDQKEKMSERAKELWKQKSPEELKHMKDAANAATRLAAKEGSKLEKYLFLQLIKHGWRPEFHKERFVVRSKLQVDIFIPELNVAIEVDGPGHFADIWGKGVLAKNQLRDSQMEGLLLEKGCVVIRIVQDKQLSAKNKRDILSKLLDTLAKIKTQFPEKGKRHLTIGVD